MSKQELLDYINDNLGAMTFEHAKMDFITPKQFDATYARRAEVNERGELAQNVDYFTITQENGVLVRIDGPLGRIGLRLEDGKYVEA